MGRAEVSVRRATVDDAPAIGALHAASWLAAYRGKMPDEVLDDLSAEEMEERRRQHLEDETPESSAARTFVAVVEGAVRGFAVTGPSREDIVGSEPVPSATIGELYAIYLHPDWFGRGVGMPLWEAALADLRARGFTEVTVSVLEANQRARRFYEHLGFALDRVGIRPLGEHQLSHAVYRLNLST